MKQFLWRAVTDAVHSTLDVRNSGRACTSAYPLIHEQDSQFLHNLVRIAPISTVTSAALLREKKGERQGPRDRGADVRRTEDGQTGIGTHARKHAGT